MIDFGHGVFLDAIKPCDLSILIKWRNHPAIWKWCRQVGPIMWPNHEKWFQAMSSDPTQRMFLIREGTVRGLADFEKAQPLGVCGLTSLDLLNRRAEFSLYIGTEFQRHGFGKKSLKTLLGYGFEHLGLNNIWGETYSGNPALQMFFSLGFKESGKRSQFYFREGKFIDAYLVEMLKDTWNQKTS